MKTLQCGTWQEFRDFVHDDILGFKMYWRGQRDPSWQLASRFERVFANVSSSTRNKMGKDFYRQSRDGYLKRFQRAASGLRGPNPKPLSTEEWWALGRHYGLITPLLDWTEKPYIASFFALAEHFEQRQYSSLLGEADQPVAIYRLFHTSKLEGDGLRVVRPTIDELGRLQSQRSVFTWLDSEEYFDLQTFMDRTGRGDLLTKITLSERAMFDGLNDLDMHGIDYRLLFPDLAGAALSANMSKVVQI